MSNVRLHLEDNAMGDYLAKVRIVTQDDATFHELKIIKGAPSAEAALDYAICMSTGTDHLEWSCDGVDDPVMNRVYAGDAKPVFAEDIELLEEYIEDSFVFNQSVLDESGNYLEHLAQ